MLGFEWRGYTGWCDQIFQDVSTQDQASQDNLSIKVDLRIVCELEVIVKTNRRKDNTPILAADPVQDIKQTRKRNHRGLLPEAWDRKTVGI